MTVRKARGRATFSDPKKVGATYFDPVELQAIYFDPKRHQATFSVQEDRHSEMEWYETERQSRIFSAPVERHHIYLDPKKPQVICLDQRKPQAIYSDPERQRAYRGEMVITSDPERLQDISSDQDEDKVTSLDLGVGKKKEKTVLQTTTIKALKLGRDTSSEQENRFRQCQQMMTMMS